MNLEREKDIQDPREICKLIAKLEGWELVEHQGEKLEYVGLNNLVRSLDETSGKRSFEEFFFKKIGSIPCKIGYDSMVGFSTDGKTMKHNTGYDFWKYFDSLDALAAAYFEDAKSGRFKAKSLSELKMKLAIEGKEEADA